MLKVYAISKKKQLGKYIEKATEDHYWHTNPQHGSLNRKLWELRKRSAELSVIRLACFHPAPQAFGISHVLQKGMRRVGLAHSPWRQHQVKAQMGWSKLRVQTTHEYKVFKIRAYQVPHSLNQIMHLS